MLSINLPRLLCIATASIALLLCIYLSSYTHVSAQISNCSQITPQGQCIMFGTGTPPGALNLDVEVSGFVPETAVRLQGYTAPGAFVIVTESNDVVGAATAEADGSFDFILHALQAGSPKSLNIFASTNYQTTPGTGFVVTPVQNSVVTVSNIVLPPFILVTPGAADLGNPINIHGDGTPGATVNVFVESPLVSTTTTVAGDGTWSIDAITEFGVLPEGAYSTYAYQSVGAYQSVNSQVITFEVRQTQSTTFLTLNGFGPPGGFLTFKDGNTTIGSGIIDAGGTFSETLQFPDATVSITIDIIVDDGSQVSPTTSVAANLVSQTTTTVNNILLPSFINVTPVLANVGQAINVTGVAAPNASLELQIESPVQTTTLTVPANGNWSKELIATFGNLPEGVYQASAVVSKTSPAATSVRSRLITFTVTEVETATDLVVNGYGAPNAFLTFTENNQVIGTAVIPTSGVFTHTLKFADQTLPHTVSITADNGTQQTPPTTFTVTVTALSTTTVSNIVLPTFINVPSQIPYGNSIPASGTGAPNALIQVFVRNPLIDKPVTSGADGKWQLDLNTIAGPLAKGQYTVYARTTILPQNYQSGISRELAFEVTEADLCAERRSDLNCDNRVDITDLGILIFYWGAAGSGQKADINVDGQVSIQDVGIMVFDWTY